MITSLIQIIKEKICLLILGVFSVTVVLLSCKLEQFYMIAMEERKKKRKENSNVG